MPKKLTYEFVKQYFEDHGCKLLAKEYFNVNIPLKYKCSCKNISYITFHNFKQGHRCMKCGVKKRTNKRKLTFKEVKQYFKEHGCKLLEEEYFNNHTKMEYKCKCGRTSYITFNSFQQGHRCYECGIKKNLGKNNPNYNPNLTNEERKNKRKSTEDAKWIKDIYKQNNNTCQYCFKKGGKINAHHIESYGSNEELRTVVSNGICFCEEHHIKFHKKYGYKNNNKEQLEEYLNTINLKAH